MKAITAQMFHAIQETQSHTMYVCGGTLVVRRVARNQTALMLITTSDDSTMAQRLTLDPEEFENLLAALTDGFIRHGEEATITHADRTPVRLWFRVPYVIGEAQLRYLSLSLGNGTSHMPMCVGEMEMLKRELSLYRIATDGAGTDAVHDGDEDYYDDEIDMLPF